MDGAAWLEIDAAIARAMKIDLLLVTIADFIAAGLSVDFCVSFNIFDIKMQ